jgi:hypothetical protein
MVIISLVFGIMVCSNKTQPKHWFNSNPLKVTIFTRVSPTKFMMSALNNLGKKIVKYTG